MNPPYDSLASLFSILALGMVAFLVNVLLHELGHAIPILFWSKKKVKVYIGSLGDAGKSLRLPMGRLEVYLKYNPFLWMRGLCRLEERLPVGQMIFYTAMGPLVSLLITITCFVLLKTMEPSERQTIVLVTFMVIGGSFTLGTAIPRGRLSPTDLGGGVRNDATQVLQLWRARNMPDAYWAAMDMMRAKEYVEAANLLETVIGEGHSSVVIYRLSVVAYYQAGNFERAGELQELIRGNYPLSVEDQINDGCLRIVAGRYREAVSIYRELLRLYHNHFLILNNMGYSLIAAGEAENALMYLDRGITLAPKFVELWSTRAWAKMELGQWEDGIVDATQALKLNAESANTHRVLGLYALHQGQLQEAGDYFARARLIDPRTLFLEEPLAELKRLQALAERSDVVG